MGCHAGFEPKAIALRFATDARPCNDRRTSAIKADRFRLQLALPEPEVLGVPTLLFSSAAAGQDLASLGLAREVFGWPDAGALPASPR